MAEKEWCNIKRLVLVTVIIFVGAFTFFALNSCSNYQNEEKIVPYAIEAGGVFEPGAYIDFANVHIVYNGNYSFLITNNGDNIESVIVMVVGVKKDGSYDLIQCPAFGGIDEKQYKQDKTDNGWAIPQYTNRVRPNDTLTASASIVKIDGYPDPDIDGDGYYELVFVISPQDSMNSIHSSTDDPETDIYKLPVNG